MDDETSDSLVQMLTKRIMGLDDMEHFLLSQMAITLMGKGDLLTIQEYDALAIALEKQRRYIMTFGGYKS